MPFIQRKTILKDFENHKLKYIMNMNLFNKVFYSFELIIHVTFCKSKFLIKLFTIDKVSKLKTFV
jgi:hypothetical protein